MFKPTAIFVLLALSRATAALPAGELTAAFSFEKWVEDIIANPTGKHLSPDEAVAAFYASAAGGHSPSGQDNIISRCKVTNFMIDDKAACNLLQKSCMCNTIPDTEASV